jgi:hypothetical protein
MFVADRFPAITCSGWPLKEPGQVRGRVRDQQALTPGHPIRMQGRKRAHRMIRKTVRYIGSRSSSAQVCNTLWSHIPFDRLLLDKQAEEHKLLAGSNLFDGSLIADSLIVAYNSFVVRNSSCTEFGSTLSDELFCT